MKKNVLSPIHEDYKKLDSKDKELLEKCGIYPHSLRGDTNFSSNIFFMKKVEKFELDLKETKNEIILINKSLENIDRDIIDLNNRIEKLEKPPIENLPN